MPEKTIVVSVALPVRHYAAFKKYNGKVSENVRAAVADYIESNQKRFPSVAIPPMPAFPPDPRTVAELAGHYKNLAFPDVYVLGNQHRFQTWCDQYMEAACVYPPERDMPQYAWLLEWKQGDDS